MSRTRQELNNRIQELNKQLRDRGNEAHRAGETYTATMTLYNVAVSAEDPAEQEKHRLTMHSMLDVILDTGLCIYQMNKELIEITDEFLRAQH